MQQTPFNPNRPEINLGFMKYLIPIVIVVIIAGVIISKCFVTVPAGHVGVGSVFGKVQDVSYPEGMSFVNPFLKLTLFDARQKTLKESMGVPSKDQLITDFELSIQYRLIKEKASSMLKETGTPKEVLDVHLIPLLRSQMREIGKSVLTAEEFYSQAVQQRIQKSLQASLKSALSTKGINIDKLLIRDITLPRVITQAVIRRKEAAQAAEKAKEELKKYKVEQEKKEAQANAEKKAELIDAQKKKEVMIIAANANLEAARIEAKRKKEVQIIAAEAKRDAAILEAEAIITKANAQAAAKKAIIDTITLDGFIKLESMETLKAMQNGNHTIILDAKATSPLPFLNLNKQ